jgi:Tol biopolymer transport system component
LFSVETAEKRKLTNPAEGDTAPAISPDGRILAFARLHYPYRDLCLLRLGEGYMPQGEPERISAENPNNIGAAWTSAGTEIVFSSGIAFSATKSVSYGLWRVAPSASATPRSLPVASENARAPAISRQRNRLAYAVERTDTNIWRVDLQGADRRPAVPVRLIASTRADQQPDFSPDGKRIVFGSDRSGTYEIWMCERDGSNPVPLTSFGKSGNFGGMKWSPDGRSIVFHMQIEGKRAIYVVNTNKDAPHRLTRDPWPCKWPSWSWNGQWIYFVGRGEQIWRIHVDSGDAEQVTRDPDRADLPHESPDGKSLYYSKGWPNPQTVWRVSLKGGEATKVLSGVSSTAFWTVGRDGIYFFATPDEKGHSDLSVYEFATSKTRKILTVERPVEWSASLYGRSILYTQVDETDSDLMLVENFR